MKTERDVDAVFRDGLNELQGLPPLDLQDRVEAHVRHNDRRTRAKWAGASAAIFAVLVLLGVLLAPSSRPSKVELAQDGRTQNDNPAGTATTTPTTLAVNSKPPSGEKPGDAKTPNGNTGGNSSSQTPGGNGSPANGVAPVDPGQPDPGNQNPADPTTKPRPVDVDTKLVVSRHGGSLTMSVPSVTGPNFPITYSAPAGSPSLMVGGETLAPGATKNIMHGVGSLALVSGGTSITVDVVAPALAAPKESTTITLDMQEGSIGLPNRTVADNAPYVEGLGAPTGVRWSAIKAGTYKLRFVNTMDRTRTYFVTGYGRVFVPRGTPEVTVTVTFTARADRTFRIYAVTDRREKDGESLVLWQL